MKKIHFTFGQFKSTLIILLLSSSLCSYAKDNDYTTPYYVITKNEVDHSLVKTQSLFVFTFKNSSEGTLIQNDIKGACNGIEKTIHPDVKGQSSLYLPPGKYTFQFFYNQEFYEIQTDSILIEPAHRIEITVNFESAIEPVISFKPVIYAYPKKTTPINIKLDLKGEFLFTYPQYNNGWDFIADPNGTIHMNNKQYKYLFWDGTTNINTAAINWNEGFVVNKDSLLSFLENKLTIMGLSFSEQQDYITFWYPLMSKNDSNYIHFLFNEEYDQYAHISVDPKPDNMFRVYMMWTNAEEIEEIKLKEQVIPSFQREGFTIVEWGGAQLAQIPQNHL